MRNNNNNIYNNIYNNSIYIYLIHFKIINITIELKYHLKHTFDKIRFKIITCYYVIIYNKKEIIFFNYIYIFETKLLYLFVRTKSR